MNKARRKRIENAWAKLVDIIEELNEIKDEEQECFDNLPESLQYSEKGETMEEYISNLEDAINELESASTTLDDMVNQ